MDRNNTGSQIFVNVLQSLSARRAWIEIPHTSHDFPAPKVALRKESVDRNAEDWLNAGCLPRSLSARRAWIEMRKCHTVDRVRAVALRKESVDRNLHVGNSAAALPSRSPQGERG